MALTTKRLGELVQDSKHLSRRTFTPEGCECSLEHRCDACRLKHLIMEVPNLVAEVQRSRQLGATSE